MKYLFVFLLFFPLAGIGQLVTSTSQSPSALVQDVLLGPGVEVSNINYTGHNRAIGSFEYTGSHFGLQKGIVITTGTVQNNGSGPQGPNRSPDAGIDNRAPGYSRLGNLLGSGVNTFNAAILEFDIVPYSDTLRFKYIFGSEEYREYVGSGFNDVFAFFISGPGIPGYQNIAKLPNGTPVSINTINDGAESRTTGAYTPECNNCSYFQYNGRGFNPPYNSSPEYIQYDGFTKPLEAVAKVQCGQKYHLIIAIADVNDGLYDSGIFLEANSLSSNEIVNVSKSISYEAFPEDPYMMAEGCVTATVTLTRQSKDLSSPLTVPITVNGSATMGVDYTSIPSSVTFQPGQRTISFSFDALEDGITEGIEDILLTFHIIDACGNNVERKVDFRINDVQPVSVRIEADAIVCPGSQIEVKAIASGGVGPYTYLWNTGATTSSIFVSPQSTTLYSVSVKDNCLKQVATAQKEIEVPVYIPVSGIPSPDVVEICPYIEKEIIITPQNGTAPYTYEWTENGTVIGTDSSVFVTPSTSTVYHVKITDFCGTVFDTLVRYTITSPPLTLQMSPDTVICPNDTAVISVISSGGYGQHYYLWDVDNATTPSVFVHPSQTTTYTVIVSDECQTFTVRGSTQVIVKVPVADFVISSHTLFNNLPVTFQNLTTGGVTYSWDFGDGNTSTLVHPNNTYTTSDFYQVTLIATNEIGCKDTVVKPIYIRPEHYVYVPNAFTPDGNMFNNYFTASFYGVLQAVTRIYDRWGEEIFYSDDLDFKWDGTYKGMMLPDGTYVYKITYMTIENVEETIVGHVVLIK